ncbi:monosaccharide ABC transporter membrane protein (CUT2 family) [Hydrogenispora ethanolica]|uniref:Monosaccharide ABC transporter membrane protein (CUT2 family) n=1 Tax=Hydrogenispora ethanolica TaxID=1082276 RepID=A0A4R1R7B7_HYDET|nr:ABC transporter permease [Hydrogenispora ethanolica]TCL61503.1 monosaccharide ABC transporter membrane protein (CUT2 family) [Hydrogenispora ethanolica]
MRNVPIVTEPKGVPQRSLFRSSATQKILAFASLIVMFIFFSLASPNFANVNNIIGILLSTAVNGVLAVGTTFVIITGGIDLSVGTVMTFGAVMTGVFITFLKLPIYIGVLGGLAAGALCGFISGSLTARMKIPPFIATLGMMMITKGLSLVISGTKPIYFTDTLPFMNIAMGTVLGIPSAVWIFFGVAIIANLVLTKTALGRYTFALGSNEEAARLSGINVDAWKIGIYTLGGAFSGLAGIIMASRLASAQPALGQGYEMEAIAAAVIGGTSLSGGEGTILGTVIGAFVMSVLTNGLRILSIPQEWQTVVVGSVVILAVYMDIIRRKKAH